MTWTLIIRDHGRWEYLTRCLESIDREIGLEFFDRRILSEDGHTVDFDDFECLSTGTARQGLTANLAQAWGALGPDDEWVFDVESDFVIEHAPLTEMAETLDAFPNIANMVLLRQPWNQEEIRAGSVLKTRRFLLTDMGGWLQHEAGFWLNPYVAHSGLLRRLSPDVEAGLTNQTRRMGLTYGYWGGRDDAPRCWHIGAEGGMGSEGWLR